MQIAVDNVAAVDYANFPDAHGHFGIYGGIFAPETLMAPLEDLAAAYAEMEANGIVENAELFAQNLIVERDSSNPNRLNVLFPPDLVNAMRIFAVLAQFRLQYPATA